MKFRNVSTDARFVAYGLPRSQFIEPDGLLDVPDAFAESYRCQPAIWKQVDAVTAPVQAPSLAAAQADLAKAQAEVAAASTSVV